jgi:hypothetical protein
MGFSSMDDLVSETTVNGKFLRTDFNKLTAAVGTQAAGTWYSLFQGAGNPAANTLLGTGTNAAFQAVLDSTTGNGGIPHGGDVSPDTKHILNASSFSAGATSMPAIFMLVDLLGFYPLTNATITTAQTLDNTVTLPRYTDGKGVQAFLTPSTAMGAGTPTVTLNYTRADTGGTDTGRTTPTPLPTLNATSPIGQISYSGTGSGKYGPFIPLQAGDQGIESVQQITFSATRTSGVLNLCLCKPLLTLPMTTIGVAAERDLLNQVPSLPRVHDGACLGWLMYAGAATPVSTPFFGHLDFAWG